MRLLLNVKLIIVSGLLLCIPPHAAATNSIAQVPLLLDGNIPGNLLMALSVEFPTAISASNLGNYNNRTNYPGYFDFRKCYAYQGNTTTNPESEISRNLAINDFYFYPTRVMNSSRSCSGDEWSGNYLNWAATQTIDPFRQALTGGLRHIDTPTKTVLGKATRAGRTTNLFDSRKIDGNTAALVSPYSAAITSQFASDHVIQFQRSLVRTAYYAVRVQACVNGLLEDNCVSYSQSYKPEGLLQRYANDIRYSVFSYLNIDGNNIDGGVLRSAQDYIGQYRREVGVPGNSDNPKVEWDLTTGVIFQNPHNDPIGNSGTLNYINKFGELSNQHKSNDPVSELYYAVIRYLRGLKNFDDYTNQANTDLKKDYFPVITQWKDPLLYSCQKNAILGIGDIYTHEDRDLPVKDDRFMDMNAYTQKIFDLEGINARANRVFSGRGNSAYIAGMAYWANINDMRPDLPGKQTAQTYWVDVREGQYLAPKSTNQYWLTAKYGGFKVPENYQFGARLPTESWYTTGEILETGEPRPDNFFVASDAENLTLSLERAFAKIIAEAESTLSLAAASSTRLDTETALFQAIINPRTWSGDIVAYGFDEQNRPEEKPAWSAADKLDASNYKNRQIFTIKPSTANNANLATQGIKFDWDSLSAEQRQAFRFINEKTETEAQLRVSYLRGDRSQETNKNMRQRDSLLGDIANSDPQFVYQQHYGFNRLNWKSGEVGTKYNEFRASNEYKNRIPLILVGANDGMLHAFNASFKTQQSGQELFAYVPNNIIPNLKYLTEHDYHHRYYVDSTVRVADVWLDNKWATLAVGGQGAGGNSIFALDITNITNTTSFNSSKVLWEFSHPDMGYSLGQPALVALPNKEFGVIFTSGHTDDETANGYVWILNAKTGQEIKKITLPKAGGLGAPLASDLTNNLEADRIYVGDTLGKVWRIDLTGSSPNNWGIPSALNNGPLFLAKQADGTAQSITAPLISAFNKEGEHMVIFGTGSFFREGDNEQTTTIDSLYAIIDRNQLINGRSKLLQQHIIKEDKVKDVDVRAFSNYTMNKDHQGWLIDLAWYPAQGGPGRKGERVLSQADLSSGRVLFTSMTPNPNPCTPGGTSYIMALDLFTGSRLDYSYFDINQDGFLNGNDYTIINGEKVPWSGISKEEDGVIKGVSHLKGGADNETRVICFIGSGGNGVQCSQVAGSQKTGRQSWREVTVENK